MEHFAQVYRVGQAVGVRAVPHRELQAQLLDQSLGGPLVVHRKRDDLDVELVERVRRALERTKLSVAVRAPGTPLDEHDTVAAGECIRKRHGAVAGLAQDEGREGVAWLEKGHENSLISERRRWRNRRKSRADRPPALTLGWRPPQKCAGWSRRKTAPGGGRNSSRSESVRAVLPDIRAKEIR
jgi:hypothetical protein